jgi:23S rRNA pseudouridine1911/1915/1917 synthase
MSTKGKAINLVAARSDAGTRLDLFMVAAARDMSRKKAKKLIDTRRVSVNGRIEGMASRALKGGERIEVRLPDEQKVETPKVTVFHEEPAFIAVAKSPGIPSGPTIDPKRLHAQKVAENTLGERLTLLHRIDRDTSGLLLMARDKGFAEALLTAFRTREVEKRYLAIVSGRTPPKFDDVCHLKEVQGGKVAVVKSGGMKAETSFETLAFAGGASLVLAKPRTGRMHQLRAQLSRKGFPILGDSLYGGSASVSLDDGGGGGGGGGKNRPRVRGRAKAKPVKTSTQKVTVDRQMLHAWKIAFTHPETGERMELCCPPPEDFVQAVKAIFAKKAPNLEELKGF